MVRNLFVAIPAYNEEHTIHSVVTSIRKNIPTKWQGFIVVVDDGSTDKTVDIAIDAGVDLVVCHRRNQGVARAIRTAIVESVRYGANLVCTIDADGQFSPSDLGTVIEPIEERKSDLVLGSRFVGGINGNSVPILNLITNRLMASLVGTIIGQKLSDVETGFRAVSADAARRLNLIGFGSFSYDMVLDLHFKGFRIKEVPVSVRYFSNRTSRVIHGFLKYGFRSICSIVLKLLSIHKLIRLPQDNGDTSELAYMSERLFSAVSSGAPFIQRGETVENTRCARI